MSKGQEQYAQDLIQIINGKFADSDPKLYLDEFDVPEEYESSHQELSLIATTALSLCPTDNLKVRAARPKPTEETSAELEDWHDYDVYCVTVEERYANKSQIQTDFYVKTGRILMRRMVTFLDDYNFLPGESDNVYLHRQVEQLVDHMWHLIAPPEKVPDEKTHGRPLTLDESEELLQWMHDTDVAQDDS